MGRLGDGLCQVGAVQRMRPARVRRCDRQCRLPQVVARCTGENGLGDARAQDSDVLSNDEPVSIAAGAALVARKRAQTGILGVTPAGRRSDVPRRRAQCMAQNDSIMASASRRCCRARA